MNKSLILLIILIITGGAFGLWYKNSKKSIIFTPTSQIKSFDDCITAGYPVAESYPRQCSTPDGKSFSENIGNILEKQDLIRVLNITPGDTIESPLLITGEARGNWFFEASFPVMLYDNKGNEIASGHAEATGDWMTEDFVGFKANLQFTLRADVAEGKLVLQKDNPSGLPQNDDKLEIPVKFRINE